MCKEKNAEVFEKYFEGATEWAMDYVQSDDYAGELIYIIWEGYRANERLARLLRKEYGIDCQEIADDLACHIKTNQLEEWSVFDEYSGDSDHDIYCFPIGEHHDQLDLSMIRDQIGDQIDGDLLEELSSWLEEQREFSIHESLGGRYPSVTLITYTGLRIDYRVSEEVVEEFLENAKVGVDASR